MPRLIRRSLLATDHVGSGGPSNVDLLTAPADWVERSKAPAGLELVQQDTTVPFAVTRSRPRCEWPQWPQWPHYKGGAVNRAGSFECTH